MWADFFGAFPDYKPARGHRAPRRGRRGGLATWLSAHPLPPEHNGYDGSALDAGLQSALAERYASLAAAGVARHFVPSFFVHASRSSPHGRPPRPDAFRELVARGRLAAQPAPRPLPVGNVDRRASALRSSWQATLPDGRQVRITLGARLGEHARRHAAFAAALPDLIPAPVFHESLANHEAFACVFFPGESLETVARENPVAAQSAFARVGMALASTEQSSTEAARLAEWGEWTAAVEARDFWTDAERSLLRDTIWPRLYPLLAAQPPVRRWTNGDFTSTNILVDSAGAVRLIDCEFASATHFFGEDSARFHVLSPVAREQPELFAAALPPAGPAWHLYFWLRQLMLEFDQNTPAYFARYAPVRLAVIRRLAEQLFGVVLTAWSAAAVVVHEVVETARWDNAGIGTIWLAGWCHVPGTVVRRIVATQHERHLGSTAPQARPDVQAHFAGAPAALATGFDWVGSLQQRDDPVILSVATDDNTMLPFHSFRPVDLPGRRPWLRNYPGMGAAPRRGSRAAARARWPVRGSPSCCRCSTCRRPCCAHASRRCDSSTTCVGNS